MLREHVPMTCAEHVAKSSCRSLAMWQTIANITTRRQNMSAYGDILLPFTLLQFVICTYMLIKLGPNEYKNALRFIQKKYMYKKYIFRAS